MRIRAYSAPTVSRESRETMNATSYAFEESTISQEAMSIYRDLEKFGKVSEDFFSLSFEGNISRARIVYNQKEIMRLAKIMNFNMDVPTISTEDCDNNIEYARQLSIEAGDSFLSKMRDAIVGFINRIIDWFKNLFGSSSGGGGGGSAKAKELQEDKELKGYVDRLKSGEKVKSSFDYQMCAVINTMYQEPDNNDHTFGRAFEFVKDIKNKVDIFKQLSDDMSETIGSNLSKNRIDYNRIDSLHIGDKVISKFLLNHVRKDPEFVMYNHKIHVFAFLDGIRNNKVTSVLMSDGLVGKSKFPKIKTETIFYFHEFAGINPPSEYYFTSKNIVDYSESLNHCIKYHDNYTNMLNSINSGLKKLEKLIDEQEIQSKEEAKEFYNFLRSLLQMYVPMGACMSKFVTDTVKIVESIKSDLKKHFDAIDNPKNEADEKTETDEKDEPKRIKSDNASNALIPGA